MGETALLRRCAGTLAEIAARLGYYNAAYFTNIFKRHVTMLPDGNRPATPAYKIRNL